MHRGDSADALHDDHDSLLHWHIQPYTNQRMCMKSVSPHTHTQTITLLQRNTLLHRLAYSVIVTRTGSRTALSLNSAKQKTVENTKQ